MFSAPRSFAMGRFCFALIKPLRHGFAVPLPGLRHPASAALCLRLAGRGPNSDSLFPPLAAVVVVAPNEGRLWHTGKLFLFARGSPR